MPFEITDPKCRMELTDWERKLAAKLLKVASDQFINHGCNDFDAAKEAGLTEEECEALWEQLGEWDTDCLKRDDTLFLDWLLMRFLADKLGG